MKRFFLLLFIGILCIQYAFPGTKKQASPTETIPTGKPIDWYLEKGDEYFNKGKYQVAQKYYQHMLKIDPADPIAPKKISGCEQMIHRSKEERKFYSYIERADKYFSQNKVDYALEYYLAAYKSLPSKGREVVVKFKTVSKSHPEKWEKFKSENISDLEHLDKYSIPPGMPEEVYGMKSKAKKVYKNEKGYWEAEFDYNIVMIYIPAGEFLMGSNEGYKDEKPIHSVFLDGYWIGKYEITQWQWEEIMGSNPSRFKLGDKYPVESVSWEDVQQFIQKLNSRVGLSFRLPTEAEWEKAARGKDQRKYPWGSDSPSCLLTNYSGCGGQTKPVGSRF